MTHELKTLFETAYYWQENGITCVLATVVALEGSSYRRPGVRMLIAESGEMKGAVSGGCVEKEVYRQSLSVFSDGVPKMMTYDGRFRLGCEGILYILLEPIHISEVLHKTLQKKFDERSFFESTSFYSDAIEAQQGLGTTITIDSNKFHLHTEEEFKKAEDSKVFNQHFPPLFQLYIFGAEHDAVELSKMASQLGWQVHIVAPPDEEKAISFFNGATSLSTPLFTEIDTSKMDKNTAVILMSHSLNKDVQYLLALKDIKPAYFGLLGPSKRRERLFSEFLKIYPDTSFEFFEQFHGPAGLDIGAESAQEIALSILSEILSVVRKASPKSLRVKSGKIHE